MKTSMKAKLAVDAGMTVSLLLLMAYGLVGEKAHEWLGIGMFVLFVLHHILNRKWFGTAVKRNHSPMSIIKSALVVLIFLCMIGLAVSGIALSRYVFSSLPKHGGQEIFEKLHKLRRVEPDVPEEFVFRHIAALFVSLYVSMVSSKKHHTAPKNKSIRCEAVF